MPQVEYHGPSELLNRLRDDAKQVVFVVGAALTAPVTTGTPGVPNVDGFIDLIREELANKALAENNLDAKLKGSENRYQAAFDYLEGILSAQGVGRIVEKAVLKAYTGKLNRSIALPENKHRELEDKLHEWRLSPGVEALGRIIAAKSNRFTTVITSNFDPLIEIAIRRAAASKLDVRTTILDKDGNLNQNIGRGCHVIHIHGYWHSSNTLHTVTHLSKKRQLFQKSLVELLTGKTVVVMGYGGWQDSFTATLRHLSGGRDAYPEIIWTFYEEPPCISKKLWNSFTDVRKMDRIHYYAGIDCHVFLPRLADLIERDITQSPSSVSITNGTLWNSTGQKRHLDAPPAESTQSNSVVELTPALLDKIDQDPELFHLARFLLKAQEIGQANGDRDLIYVDKNLSKIAGIDRMRGLRFQAKSGEMYVYRIHADPPLKDRVLETNLATGFHNAGILKDKQLVLELRGKYSELISPHGRRRHPGLIWKLVDIV